MDFSLRDRIRYVRKEHNMSQVQFAEKLEVTQSVVSLMEAGKASVSVEVLKRISSSFDISCDWLIYGQDKFAKLSHEQDFIPLVRKEAKPGYLNNYKDQDYLNSLELYKIPGFEKGNYRLFEIEGNGMMPSVFPKDKVICIKTGLSDFIEGSICVLITAKDIFLKRVFLSKEHPGMVVLHCNNPGSETVEISKNEIKEIWQVQAKITHSFTNNQLEHNQRLNEVEKEIVELKTYVKQMLRKVESSRPLSEVALKQLWEKDLKGEE